MRLSEGELHRLAAGTQQGAGQDSENPFFSGIGAEAAELAENLRAGDEIREELVLSLKERIDAGTYQVSGDEIAEMMIRRAMADRLAAR